MGWIDRARAAVASVVARVRSVVTGQGGEARPAPSAPAPQERGQARPTQATEQSEPTIRVGQGETRTRTATPPPSGDAGAPRDEGKARRMAATEAGAREGIQGSKRQGQPAAPPTSPPGDIAPGAFIPQERNRAAWRFLGQADAEAQRGASAMARGQMEEAAVALDHATTALQAVRETLEDLPDPDAAAALGSVVEEVSALQDQVAAAMATVAAEVVAEADAVIEAAGPVVDAWDPGVGLVQLNGGSYVSDDSGDTWAAGVKLYDDCAQPGLSKLLGYGALAVRADFVDLNGELHQIRVPNGLIRESPEAITAWLDEIFQLEGWRYVQMEIDGYEEY